MVRTWLNNRHVLFGYRSFMHDICSMNAVDVNVDAGHDRGCDNLLGGRPIHLSSCFGRHDHYCYDGLIFNGVDFLFAWI
jgi:hypothetical protein